MPIDEVVDSSDGEEVEALRALSPNYWPRIAGSRETIERSGTANVAVHHQNHANITRALQSPPSSLALLAHYSSPGSDEEAPPLKRIKLSDTYSPPRHVPSSPQHATSAAHTSKTAPSPTRRTRSLSCSPIPFDTMHVRSSSAESSLLPTPELLDVKEEDDPIIIAEYDEDEDMHDAPEVFPDRRNGLSDESGSWKSGETQVAGHTPQPRSHLNRSRSRSFSRDPLAFFTQEPHAQRRVDIAWYTPPKDFINSPRSRSASPDPLSPSQNSQTRQPAASPLFTPTRHRTDSLISSPAHLHRVHVPSSAPPSPLIPASSPRKHPLPYSEPLSPAVPFPSSPPPPASPPPEQPDHESNTPLPQKTAGRYSLRTRQAKQVNPYAYDKRLYKHQLRGMPDAIVKVVSPRERRRSPGARTRSDERSDVDDAYQDAGDDDEETQEMQWATRRRIGKSRSISAGEDLRRDSSADEPRVPRVKTPGQLQRQHHEWYPEVFAERFSSGSEESETLVPRPKEQDDAHVKHRRKPFPMRRKLYQTPPSHESPSSRPNASESSVGRDADDDNEMPLPTWRKRKSSTFSSVRSPSRSSQASNVPSPIAPFDDFDHFEDFGSPAPPAPSTPTDIDMLPSQALPLTSADEQNHSPAADDSDSDVEFVGEGPRRLRRLSRSPALDEPQSSPDTLATLDRRKAKALKRMWPAVMIKKLGDAPRARVRRASDSSSGENIGPERVGDGRPLLPGQSKVRRIERTSHTPMSIHGDSESSDVEVVDNDLRVRSSSESDVEIIVPSSSRPRRPPRIHVHLTNTPEPPDPEPGDISVESSGADDRGFVRVHRTAVRTGEAREGDLIDRMLSRTNIIKRSKRARGRTGGGGSGGGGGGSGSVRHGGSSSTHVNVTTAGARRTGIGRQATLPFARVSSTADPTMDDDANVPVENHLQLDEASARVAHKRKKHKHNGNIYVFADGHAHITSGRSHIRPVTIDAEDEYSSMPQDRAIERTRPGSKRHAGAAKTPVSTVGSTLDDYWDRDENAAAARSAVKPRRRRTSDIDLALRRKVTVDFRVPVLPSGLAFGPTTFLGRGWLYELLALFPADHDILRPALCNIFELHLHPEMPAQDFAVCFEQTCDRAHDLLKQGRELDVDEGDQWQSLLHSMAQHTSWLIDKADDEVYVSLHAAIVKHSVRLRDILDEPVEIIPDDETPSQLAFELRWFLVELTCRMECHRRKRHNQVDDSMLLLYVKLLMRHLLEYGFANTMEPFLQDQDVTLEQPSLSRRTAELWVCLIHTATSWATSMVPNPDRQISVRSFWDVYIESTRMEGAMFLTTSEFMATEIMWGSIFRLCALSQFSVHGMTTSSFRLPTSWPVVMVALEKIHLASDPAADANLTPRSLRKRDEYIRVLVKRCLVLAQKWRWTLDNASAMFSRLLEIFKSRGFANLADESPDVPSFLRNNNLQQLYEDRRSDTAFTLLLKLIVQAAKENKNPTADVPVRIASNVKKLLSLSVPVGSVPFTKNTPPTDRELSMLYNRFSAIAVAIYLEPTVTNIKYRVALARRYVNFKDTHQEARRACIRALKHFTILLRHVHLSLDDVLDWLADMTTILVDECRTTDSQPRKPPTQGIPRASTEGIQMVLGCVRHIIETPVMEPGQTSAPYPDPVLLQGPWVTRIFAHQSNLTGDVGIAVQIRRLVQAFLRARADVIPPPRRPPLVTIPDEESQDDYGHFDLDLDDPELLAALGEEVESALVKENKEKDKLISKTIDLHISPAIYRLVMRHFSNATFDGTLDQYRQSADEWIDCWVGCASVLVQNGVRDWSLYLTLGPQSWEKISDSAWRRRVGLRFMYMLLMHDPSAYPKYKERFFDVLMEAMVTSRITMEHDYVSLLFSIDGLRHPLLQGIPCEPVDGQRDYKLSTKDFNDKRLSFLETIFDNLVQSLKGEIEGDVALVAFNQMSISSIVTMLSTMQAIRQQLSQSEDHIRYTTFCQQVSQNLLRHVALKNNSRLASLLNWASHLT